MSVQRLGPGEAQRLREIRLRALQEAPDAFCSTYAETSQRPLASWVQQLADLPTFVAVQGARDVGMVRTAPIEAAPGVHGVISMWVAPETRGRGIGAQLIEAVVAWGRAERVTELRLEVADDNVSAIGLYERMGFSRTGATSTLPPPRQHLGLHERALRLT
ncbi:MAG: GNAT family N-acetyltransferase [Myxococcota bacterium]